MTHRLYRVQRFKVIAGTRMVYGAKSFVGTLDRAHRRLVKLFGGTAPVRRLAPGRYSIADGAAELEAL